MKKSSKFTAYLIIIISLLIPVNAYASKNEDIYVALGGEPFGIKMFSDGLIVVKIESFETEKGSCCPAEDAGINVNDIIYSANNILLKSSTNLKEIIATSNGEKINLKIKRDEKYLNIELTPQMSTDGDYKAGLWVKDSAAGIGTITFYNDKYTSFCGLGHGICDTETGALIPISYGEVDEASISSVTKSSCGNVGTLNGYFTDNVIGDAVENNQTGIYGISKSTNYQKNIIPLAKPEEVVKGKAYIYTTTQGSKAEKYEIEITKIDMNDETVNMIIKITDERLLDITGGIVQGMSGSPIVQNDKLVGAVTHVLVDDVAYGYGIFAQTMYEVMEEVC